MAKTFLFLSGHRTRAGRAIDSSRVLAQGMPVETYGRSLYYKIMKMRSRFAVLFATFSFISLLFSPKALAAPIPGTSSSAIISESPGLFYSARGFQIDSGKTAWRQQEPPKGIPSLVTVYSSPAQKSGQQAALTVRVDEMARALTLKGYVKKWMQDYSRFGFDVLSAKPIKVNNNSAFLLDIVSQETSRQMRQVVFVKQKTAVILTCRDHRDTFSETVPVCNNIIRTFQWTK